jgi:asparagine synthase (glutamine-hydrolysing)
MAVSLEARAPLLDHRVAELALQLPLDLKWRGGTSKWLLRRILYKKVLPALLERPKMGFGVPLTDWFRGPMREEMEQKLSSGELAALGLDPGPARSLWAAFKAGRSHRSDLLWSVYALIAWSGKWRVAGASANPAGRI